MSGYVSNVGNVSSVPIFNKCRLYVSIVGVCIKCRECVMCLESGYISGVVYYCLCMCQMSGASV